MEQKCYLHEHKEYCKSRIYVVKLFFETQNCMKNRLKWNLHTNKLVNFIIRLFPIFGRELFSVCGIKSLKHKTCSFLWCCCGNFFHLLPCCNFQVINSKLNLKIRVPYLMAPQGVNIWNENYLRPLNSFHLKIASHWHHSSSIFKPLNFPMKGNFCDMKIEVILVHAAREFCTSYFKIHHGTMSLISVSM